MSKTKIIGWTAMLVCVLGYGGSALTLVAVKMDYLALTIPQTAVIGGGLAILGEIGLWVGAGCLGLTLFKKRKAMFDRLFRRKSAPAQV
jgi:hypothetical protein